MATFKTNAYVDFTTDFAPLSLLTNAGNYHGVSTSGFDANDSLFGPDVAVQGTFAQAPVAGTIHRLSVYYFRDVQERITGLSVDLDTLVNALKGGVQKGLALLFAHNDLMFGSGFADIILGYGGNDVIHGRGGGDTLIGGGGKDVLLGELHDDRLHGGAGADVLYGGPGTDELDGGAGADRLDGGAGYDFADYAGTAGGVTVTLRGAKATHATVAGQPGDELIRIEGLLGGKGSDHFTGDAGRNQMTGEGGADVLSGAGGKDALLGGSGKDALRGGAGADRLIGEAGSDILTGGAGADAFCFGWSETFKNGGVDIIADFKHGVDKIELNILLFTKFSGLVGQFALGTPQDANDYVIYDRATGKLFYDDDGNGSDAPHLFAILANHAKLTASDLDLMPIF